MDEITTWLTGRLPEDWFTAAPTVSVDREEILVIGEIPAPEVEGEDAARREAEAGRIKRFREDTRSARMRIADEAEHRYGRKVAWGAACGETTQVFTSLAIPVMTRLRQPERQVLDTLVAAGIARSRSDALAWSVRLVGKHNAEWIADLENALDAVREARANGPAA
jgi:hypothetical protein